MAIYNYSGDEIGGSVTTSAIKTALLTAVNEGSISLGSVIGSTLTFTPVSDTWLTNAETAYASMLAYYNEKPNVSIPFFISTDQHGRELGQHRWANNIDGDGVDFVNINLGDTVTDSFNAQIMNGYEQIWQVKNYIGVVGNHDHKYTSTLVDVSELARLFSTTNLLRENSPSVESFYSVVDGKHGVRYIIVDDYLTNATKTGFSNGIQTATMDWFIQQLTDSTQDIVILKHWYLEPEENDVFTDREGTTWTSTSINPELTGLLLDRKNKTSGTITDADGVTHSYDFSGCDSELLCILHGHTHSEAYIKYGGDLRGYCADWYGHVNTCTFGIIDRTDSTLHVWVFGSNYVAEELTLSL